MKRSFTSLFVAGLCLWCIGACASQPLPEWPTPAPQTYALVQAAGWEDLLVRSVCLSVDKSYAISAEAQEQLPEWRNTREDAEPIQQVMEGFLEILGLEIMPAEAACDASMTVRAEFEPLCPRYMNAGVCCTGATLELEVSLSAPGRPTLDWQESRINSASTVVFEGGCTHAWSAPYGGLWREPLSDLLLGAFGDYAYCPALFHLWIPKMHIDEYIWNPNFESSEAAVAVPCLVDLLRHPDPFVRERATFWLGMIGPEAKAAVPYLIQIRLEQGKDGERYDSETSRALVKITGVGLDPDPKQYHWSLGEWRWWWNKQDPADWGF